MTIEEKRREIFELTHKDEVARLARIYGAQPSLEVAYDKNDDGLYISGLVQAAWWGFNAALDAVVLPRREDDADGDRFAKGFNHALEGIESTGLGLKVKP